MKLENRMKNFIFVLAATVTFISTYYLMMPVIPTHMLNQGFDNITIGFVVFLFSISSLVARPLGGVLVDKWGSRRPMFMSAVLFFLTPFLVKLPMGSIGIGMAQLVYGLTVGVFTVASATFTTEISTPETIAQFMGMNSISFIVAKGLAPALGLKAMESFGFNGAVMATVIAAVTAIILIIPLTDVGGTEKAKDKSNFMEVLLHRNVLLPTLVLFCGMITFGAISAMLPVFADQRGINGIEYFFVINTCVVVISRLIMGPWSKKYLEPLTALSMILLSLSLVGMSFVYNFGQLLLVALIYGMGFAILFPILTSVMVIHIKGLSRGMALGIFTGGFDLGVATGAMMGGLSQFISLNILYLMLALIPIIGFVIFQYIYRPQIHKKVYDTDLGV